VDPSEKISHFTGNLKKIAFSGHISEKIRFCSGNLKKVRLLKFQKNFDFLGNFTKNCH